MSKKLLNKKDRNVFKFQTLRFKRDKNSEWEKGICVSSSNKDIIIDEDCNVVLAKEPEATWIVYDCNDTTDLIVNFDLNFMV